MDEHVNKKLEEFFTQYKKQIFKKGEILIRADDDPAGVYYLKEGIVKKYAISLKGEELTVNIFKPISFFPMSWALNKSQNTFYYEAVTNVIVWRAPADEVVTFVKKEHEVLFDLIKRVYRGTDGMTMRMMYLMAGSAYVRLITELMIYVQRFGMEDKNTGAFTCEISEKDIAAQAGLTRETVSRELKNLKDKKLVSFLNGVLTVTDLTKLEEELTSHS